jgi:hypothetical protein
VNFQNVEVEVCKEDTEGNPIAGWKVYLGLDEQLTGTDGCYVWTVTEPGEYTATEEDRTGWTATLPITHKFEITSGMVKQSHTFVNFQNVEVEVCKEDTEGDPIAGWKVYLEGDEKLTGENGCYVWTITEPGTYTATEEDRTGWTATLPITHDFVITSGLAKQSHTFVNFQNVEITACKYRTNDDPPTPVAMWSVLLFKDTEYVETQLTGVDGCYTWTITEPGDYQVKEASMLGWTPIGSTESEIFVVTSGSGPFYVDFYNYREPGCVLTQGYWKNHADPEKQYDEAWDSVGGPEALFFDTGSTWLEVLNTPPAGGNAYYILAHQYIAAILNGFNGADTSYVFEELAQAEALLDYYDDYGITIPEDGMEFSDNDRALAIEIAYILDEFNNGYGGVPSCED